MRAELQGISEKILKSIKLLEQRMVIGSANHRLEEFNALSESPSFWDNPQKAQKLMQERQFLVDQLEIHKNLKLELEENIELIELAELENETIVLEEAEADLKKLLIVAESKEKEALLDGEMDSNDAFLEINAGAGGTESCDWAAMLARMYVRWAEKRDYNCLLYTSDAADE